MAAIAAVAALFRAGVDTRALVLGEQEPSCAVSAATASLLV